RSEDTTRFGASAAYLLNEADIAGATPLRAPLGRPEVTMTKHRIVAMALVATAVGWAYGWTAQKNKSSGPSAGTPVKGVTIHQEVDFKVIPQRVYEVLLDTKEFSAFSGRAAQIDAALGGAFSVFAGHIVGRNVELVPGQRIVQAWRVVTWPEGVYSIARFELKSQAAGTHLVFDHTGFPEELRDHLAEGWQTNYWALLQNYFK